ncbi:hypothetical protein IF129_10820 [Streptomyces chumphonensis]|uniref:Uncharacterized protein n=1 Tax=Streptomyces chumphonensis TaxID=1214925 RepID=A0A927EZ39_9ACTN|nr:hypothetical protein [Streptomyces chumphonensis]MBD3932045.1 hypothetical protein [Streptomyces chumphonensis]
MPDLSRTREVRGDPHWNPILAAAERATGGEPCRICGEPVQRSAHWEHRDRQVCSARCNTTLKRRTKVRIERGEIDVSAIADHGDRSSADAGQRARFGEAREPRVFRTRTADGDFPYEFYGLNPIEGDVIERHGSITTYATATSLGAVELVALVRANSEPDAEPMVAIHQQTGALVAYTDRVLWWTKVPGQEHPMVQQTSFKGDDGQAIHLRPFPLRSTGCCWTTWTSDRTPRPRPTPMPDGSSQGAGPDNS